MPPNTTDLKICVETPPSCNETFLANDTKDEEIYEDECRSFRTSLPQACITLVHSTDAIPYEAEEFAPPEVSPIIRCNEKIWKAPNREETSEAMSETDIKHGHLEFSGPQPKKVLKMSAIRRRKFNSHKPPKFGEVLATMAQSMLLLALGMLICAPTVVIAALNNPNGTESFQLTDSQASWFAGILLIMQPTGSVLSGVVQELLGRKRCMLLVNIPQLGGWLLVRYATSAEHLFIAAVLMGFSIGFMEAPTLSYVGEIAQPHLRGILASFTAVYISSGMLLMYLMATFTDWRTSMALSTTIPLLTIIAILQVPESPVWLLLKNRDKEAEDALRWLRGWTSSDNIAKEFAKLKDHVQNSKVVYTKVTGQQKDGETRKPSLKEKLQDLCRPAMLRPLILVVFFFGFTHSAALNGARPYFYKVYKTLGVPVEPFVATVCSAASQILGSFACMGLVRRTGKRKLSLLSMFACSLINLFLGTYTLLYQSGQLDISWLPMVLMATLTFCTNAGIGVIPWTLLSEVFPPRGRGMGGGISAAVYYFWFFLVTKTWLDLESIINLYGLFFMYSMIGFIGVIFLYVCLPETEGKTLEDIEQIFQKKWLKK